MRFVALSFVFAAVSVVALVLSQGDHRSDVDSELRLVWLAGGVGAVVLGALRWRLLLARAALVAGVCSLVVGLVALAR